MKRAWYRHWVGCGIIIATGTVELAAQSGPRAPVTVRTDRLPTYTPEQSRVELEPAIGPTPPAVPLLDTTKQAPQELVTVPIAKPIIDVSKLETEGRVLWDSLVRRASETRPINTTLPNIAELAKLRERDLAAMPIIESEAAVLDGVRPGVTKWEEARRKFGDPRNETVKNGSGTAEFAFPPFDRAEVTVEDHLVQSILIVTPKPLDPKAAAKQLELGDIRSVIIRDTQGEILGQVFPERGVVFRLTRDGKGVEQILLEPLNNESFLQRAEELLQSEPRQACLDIESILLDQPEHPYANHLKAKLLIALGHWSDATVALDIALQAEPRHPEFRLTRANLLFQTGKYSASQQLCEDLLRDRELAAVTRGEVECLLGDALSSGPQRSYSQAIEHHQAAIKAVEKSANSENPVIRVAAKRLLVKAHLAVANDIAWGNWQQKDLAVNKWLDKARVLAADLRRNEAADAEIELLVARQALAACAGTEGLLDPTPWSKQALALDKQLQQDGDDPWRRQRIKWEMAQALYDSLQADQARGLKGYTLANSAYVVQYMEEAANFREMTPVERFMLGRLYYRVGAIFAIDKLDHRTATYWYAKALPLVEQPLPDAGPGDFARHGETLVSIGLSYWETGREEQAIELTKNGIDWIRKAIAGRAVNETSLAIPYANLATMHKARGNTTEAGEYQQLAERLEKEGGLRR